MKKLLFAIHLLLMASVSFGAFGERNCDFNSVPFKGILDINKCYDPQFSGWREVFVGETIDREIRLANYDPNAAYVVEFTNLPPGIACMSSNPPFVPAPKLVGTYTTPGLYYARFYVHRAGSTIGRTDFNQGVIVFKVNDPVFIELWCGE